MILQYAILVNREQLRSDGDNEKLTLARIIDQIHSHHLMCPFKRVTFDEDAFNSRGDEIPCIQNILACRKTKLLLNKEPRHAICVNPFVQHLPVEQLVYDTGFITGAINGIANSAIGYILSNAINDGLDIYRIVSMTYKLLDTCQSEEIPDDCMLQGICGGNIDMPDEETDMFIHVVIDVIPHAQSK